MSLEEIGGEEAQESDARSPTSTPNSHRRRRMLAMHHKEFIGEDDGGTDDEHCLMAMGRCASSSSSQDGAPPDEEPPQEREEEEEANGTTGRTGEMESDQEEDTNLDDDLRQRLVAKLGGYSGGGGVQQCGAIGARTIRTWRTPTPHSTRGKRAAVARGWWDGDGDTTTATYASQEESLNGRASSSRPPTELTATTHGVGEIAPDSEGMPLHTRVIHNNVLKA